MYVCTLYRMNVVIGNGIWDFGGFWAQYVGQSGRMPEI